MMLMSFDVTRAQASEVAIVVADFGANPDGTDAAPGFARAIAELARQGKTRLLVPPGVYTFAAESGACLTFDGLSHVEIEGAGAEFVFRGLARPLSFRHCHDVRLSGLTIRWSRPPFSQGDVADVARDHLSATIALDDITPADGWTHVEAIGEYDRRSGLIAEQGLDVYKAVTRVDPIDRRHVRLSFNRPLPLALGKTLVLRHAIYEAHAIEMQSCANMLFEAVTIRSAPGMGFVAGLTRNITVRQCEIAPPPLSGLFMSTTADAVHFGNCSGQILIESNRFVRMGDDAVNVFTSYWKIVNRPDRREMTVSQWRDYGFRSDDLPDLGDSFEIAPITTLVPKCKAESVEAHLVGSSPTSIMEMRFASDVCGVPGDFLFDEARSPKLVVRNNKFENNRARGVLAHRNAIIENNLFLNQSAQGIILEASASWMEGPDVNNVYITRNIFVGVGRWNKAMSPIMVNGRPITIDNTFVTSDNNGRGGVVIRGNLQINSQ